MSTRDEFDGAFRIQLILLVICFAVPAFLEWLFGHPSRSDWELFGALFWWMLTMLFIFTSFDSIKERLDKIAETLNLPSGTPKPKKPSMPERKVSSGDMSEPNLSTGTVVFALLCNKSALGVYTSQAKAEAARDAFARSYPDNLYEIKPFKPDGPPMFYTPY
jgi:hypothetical protein